MGKASAIQHTFNSGEYSPLMLGRQDISKYNNALFACFNGVPLPQGPWTRRPGTAFLHQAKFHSKLSRLFRFQYTITNSYLMEVGYQYIRILTQHGILTFTPQAVTSITQANPGVITKVAHGYSNGDRILLFGFTGMEQMNDWEVAVTNKTADTFEMWDSEGLKIDTTNFDAFVSGQMAKILEVPTAFVEADLAGISVTQSADTLYIFHAKYQPQTLTRTSATSWTLGNMTFSDGPYDVQAVLSATDPSATGATTLTPSGTTGNVTVTASAKTGINGGLGFQVATDIGRLLRLESTTSWGYGAIIGVASTTVCTVAVTSAFQATTATNLWRLGIWSAGLGWPNSGAFYEGRLVLGGSTSYSQRVDYSRTGNFTNFSPSNTDGTVLDSHAINFTLNSNDANQIYWIAPNEKALLVGTAAAEWALRASTLGVATTPSNIAGKPCTRYGSAAGAPSFAVVGIITLFIMRGFLKVREMAYQLFYDTFTAADVTLPAEHIPYPALNGLNLQLLPYSILWGQRSDGVLLGFTYEREQLIAAWHRHELGGFSDAAKTLIPVVESVATLTAPSGTYDEVYMIVQRYINGGVRRYIEYMTPFWHNGNELEDAFFVDAGWTVTSGTPQTVVKNLYHLEGETIEVFSDGFRQPDQIVTNGKITNPVGALINTVGYQYTSSGTAMPLEAGAQDGTAQGKLKNITRLGLWLLDTLGLKYGPAPTEILNSVYGDKYGVATPLFTGVVRVEYGTGQDRLGQVSWECDGPFPATVLGLMPQVDVSDDS